MLESVNQKNILMWRQYGEQISKGLRYQLENTDFGMVFDQLFNEQIELISSLSVESADRVIKFHDYAKEAYLNGSRTDSFTKDILQTGSVTASRARLIARTEVSRVGSLLTQTRAQSIGSDGYIWRISGQNTRDSHRAMEGKFVRWDKPPTFVEGKYKKSSMTYHAGCGPNCMCWQEVVIPEG